MKHQDVKKHPYTEFKVQEEISQIQRIMISLRRESVIVEHGRGSHTRCNVCHSMISEPTKLSKRNKAKVTYYRCKRNAITFRMRLILFVGKNCPDFDICTKCFPTVCATLWFRRGSSLLGQEAAKDIHEDHKFNMIVATDDEATISRLSPAIHKRNSSGSSRSGSSSYIKTPVSSPELLASPTLLSPKHSSLFSPTFGSASPSLPRSRSPSYASVPENIWASGQLFACDACQRNINDDHRLKCVE